MSGGGRRSRFLFSGAGATVQLSPVAKQAEGGEASDPVDGYFVSPAAHAGRVVTGVVLVAERRTVGGRELSAASSTGAAAQFGLTTVSFADKLAEQGYKVLVLDVFPDAFPSRAAPSPAAIARLEEQASSHLELLTMGVGFLKTQDVQRVGLLGVGAGADFAIKIAMERQAVVDCAVALSPHGVLPWTPAVPVSADEIGGEAEESKEEQAAAAVVPLLLLIGEKTPYANSDAVRIFFSSVVVRCFRWWYLMEFTCIWQYQKLLAACAADHSIAGALKASLFVNQGSGFAFSNITDEDAATQAIAEILDWLVLHLHRFRVAACTSDTDPWYVHVLTPWGPACCADCVCDRWPQGRNGPFFNLGSRKWHESRATWLTPTQNRYDRLFSICGLLLCRFLIDAPYLVARPPRPPPVPAHLLFDGLSSVRRTFELPQRMRLGDVIELFAEIWDVQQ